MYQAHNLLYVMGLQYLLFYVQYVVLKARPLTLLIDPSWGGPIELFLVPASAPRLV